MGMEVHNASGGNGHRQVQRREHSAATGAAGDAGAGFLEVMRKLPADRYRTSPSGLKIATIREGTGKPLAPGMKVKVQYAGWLEDGKLFDTSMKHGRPFEFTLGQGRVIKGWEEGLMGMRAGERRQLIIPASLGYGNRSVGEIPPGSTLIFNVEAEAVGEPAANPKGTMTVVA